MSTKKQSKNKIRKILQGFLFIECLIALLITSWLMFLFAIAQKKSTEGQIHVYQQFALLQHMSTFLHQLMIKSVVQESSTYKQGKFDVTLIPERYRILSSSQPMPWLGSKKLPVQPVSIMVHDKQKHTTTVVTAILTRGTP